MGPGKVVSLCMGLLKQLGVVNAAGAFAGASGGMSGTRSLIVGRAATQNIGREVTTDISFDTVTSNPDSLHNAGSPTKLFTAPEDGLYSVNGHVAWRLNGDTSGYRLTRMTHKNSAGTILYYRGVNFDAAAVPVAAPTDSNTQNMSTVIKMAAGDYVSVECIYYGGGDPLPITAQFHVYQLGY
ncbi:MAG: hypothetical protein RL139_1191 [Gemmatimonadota bacterium]|jgi:hypothetical protein